MGGRYRREDQERGGKRKRKEKEAGRLSNRNCQMTAIIVIIIIKITKQSILYRMEEGSSAESNDNHPRWRCERKARR